MGQCAYLELLLQGQAQSYHNHVVYRAEED